MHEAEKYLRDPDKPNRIKVIFNGQRRTIFRNTNPEVFGIIDKGKKKNGRLFNNWDGITRIIRPPKEVSKETRQRRLVAKVRKYAGQATFTNPFIRKCIAADEDKSLYENGLSTGNAIEGKIISLSSIAKINPFDISAFRRALQGKYLYTSVRFAFRGYECTLSTSVNTEDGGYYQPGDFCGYLSMEYKGCLNGYYYLLINDEHFIGYDID